MQNDAPSTRNAREPALAWLRSFVSATEPAGLPSFHPAPQAARALETWLVGGAALVELEDRSAEGGSIAARSLAAVHAAIVAMASVEQRSPCAALRGRLLQSAALAQAVVPGGDRNGEVGRSDGTPPSERVSAVVAVGRKHAHGAAEVARAAALDRLDAAHPRGDRELESLLTRVAAWLDFPLLVVSVVCGSETVHRAFHSTLSEPPPVVPREASYCTHCVAGEAPLVVEDARADAFFSQHPAVLAFGLVAYCGVPVRVGVGTPGEAVVGTLCGYDIRARPILVEDAATLEIFARRVASLLERRPEDAGWLDVASRHEEREVLAPGPFLDLALVALRRASSPSGARSALLVGPTLAAVPSDEALSEEGFAQIAGRLPDGRAAWLIQRRAGAESSPLDEAAARLAQKLTTRFGGPVGLSLVPVDAEDTPGPDDVADWVGRASSRPVAGHPPAG